MLNALNYNTQDFEMCFVFVNCQKSNDTDILYKVGV